MPQQNLDQYWIFWYMCVCVGVTHVSYTSLSCSGFVARQIIRSLSITIKNHNKNNNLRCYLSTQKQDIYCLQRYYYIRYAESEREREREREGEMVENNMANILFNCAMKENGIMYVCVCLLLQGSISPTFLPKAHMSIHMTFGIEDSGLPTNNNSFSTQR